MRVQLALGWVFYFDDKIRKVEVSYGKVEIKLDCVKFKLLVGMGVNKKNRLSGDYGILFSMRGLKRTWPIFKSYIKNIWNR